MSEKPVWQKIKNQATMWVYITPIERPLLPSMVGLFILILVFYFELNADRAPLIFGFFSLLLVVYFNQEKTELTRSLELQQRKLQLGELALEAAPLGQWELDLANKLIKFDRKACEVLGCPGYSESMPIHQWLGQSNEEQEQTFYRNLDSLHPETNPKIKMTLRLQKTDLTWIWVIFSGKITQADPLNRAQILVGVLIDITREKENEIRSQKDQLQLRALIESLEDLVLEVDAGGVIHSSHSGKVDLHTVLNLNRDARYIWDLFPSRIGNELRSLFVEVSRSQSSKSIEFRFESIMKWVRLKVSVLSHTETKVSGYSVIVSDITQIKDEDQKIYFASRMNSLGEMANGMAHEINNPLTIISSTASLLLNETSKETSSKEKLEKYAQRLIVNSDRIVKIINSVRAFGRVDEELPFEKVGVHDLLQGTFDLCRENLRSNGIEVRFDFKIDERRDIECRIAQLEQVLFSLIVNSVDALKSKEEKWIQVTLNEDTDGYLIIQFVDSGDGINLAHRDKVFQPFFTTKAPGSGTGLGLSVAHSLVRQHKGSIALDNLHKNTCFVLKLPLRRPRIKVTAA